MPCPGDCWMASNEVAASRVLAAEWLEPGAYTLPLAGQLWDEVHGRTTARHINGQRDMLMRNQPRVI
jgi:hypothetical protein